MRNYGLCRLFDEIKNMRKDLIIYGTVPNLQRKADQKA